MPHRPHPPREGVEEDDWKRFREVGLLDESLFEMKDRQALMHKASRLQKEVFDYQYNMGLLLMEKKQWALNFEDLSRSLDEAREILKREQSAHLIALSEFDNREANLMNSLDFEKQRVLNLQTDVRELQEDYVQVKRASDQNLSNAMALVAGIKDKSSETEQKMRAAEAQLAEVDRKSSDLDNKLQELEDHDCVLDRERLSLKTQQEAHKAAFYKQGEDLLGWKKELQRREDKLHELQKTTRDREEKAKQHETTHEVKETDLEKMQMQIDASFAKLKEKEDEVDNLLADLTVKEKKADSVRSIVEAKEKELLALEEKLKAHKEVEIQMLLDEQTGLLDVKMNELDLELEEQRKSLDAELRRKVGAVEKQEFEILHREEKLGKQERALNNKSERVKKKEEDLESKLKIVKDSDKSMKVELKKLEREKKILFGDEKSLQALKDDCEKIKAEIAKQELQICESKEELTIINGEWSEYLRLKTELIQELEKCRHQQEILSKEGDELKQEREKFEKEWEVLEEKRAPINKELKQIVTQREKLEKVQHAQEEKLKREKQAMREHLQRELESIKLEKESFEARMRHDQLLSSEKARTEHDRVVQELESQRSKLETSLISRREELEDGFQERERAFEEKRGREFKQINDLKKVAQMESEKVRPDRCIIEKDKQDLLVMNEELQGQKIAIEKDIHELWVLSKHLREQREQVIQERSHFLTFVERHNSCKNCGDSNREFVLTDLQPPDVDDSLSRMASDFVRKSEAGMDSHGVVNNGRSPFSDSRGQMSWLRKCTSKIFRISPNKMMGHVSARVPEEPSPAVVPVKEPIINALPVDGPAPSLRTDDDFTGIQQQPSADTGRGGADEHSLTIDDHSHMYSKVHEIPEDSGQSELKTDRRKSKLSWTHSVNAVVQDAKSFLGEAPEEPEGGTTILSYNDGRDEGRSILSHTDEGASNISRKRQLAPTESEQCTGHSEGRSDSVTVGGRRKRQQIAAPTVETPGKKRYNLRRHKTATTSSGIQALSDVTRDEKDVIVEATPIHETASVISQAGATTDHGKSTSLVQFETTTNVEELAPAAKSQDIIELMEEVNGTPDHAEDALNGGRIHDDQGEDEDGDDDEGDGDECESEQPGEASIGKKIWTFLTT